MRTVLTFSYILFATTLFTQVEFNLEEALKIERQDMAILAIDAYLNKKCDYGLKMERLNSSQRVLLIVENLEREINNGGFHQFYWNSTGDFANETIEALVTIGAEKTAMIVRNANAEFMSAIVPQNTKARQLMLGLIEDRAEENWNYCNSEFYSYEDDLPGLLMAYVLINKSDFEK